MKIIITSVDALIDESTGEYFEGINDALNSFKAMSNDNSVLVVSVDAERLELVKNEYQVFHIKYEYRQSGKLINSIEKHMDAEFSDIIVLGSKDADLAMAANAKVLLLSALWAECNNPYERIYSVGYGEPIESPQHLANFFSHFLNIQTPWYYRLSVTDTTDIYALTNANTYSASPDVKRMNDEFSACLKEGVDTHRLKFRTYFVLSTYRIFKELAEVKYWGIYPSSGIAHNDDLDFFKEHARKLFGARTKHPIFVKTAATNKRHFEQRNSRLAKGCREQLENITLNPWYKGRLEGETVCIIDDFTTYGTSCETARHILEAAGVAKLIFIAMGKFGREYHKYEYELSPLPAGLYSGLTCVPRGSVQLTGTFNSTANKEMLDSLGDML
jgi:hypothetical protein